MSALPTPPVPALSPASLQLSARVTKEITLLGPRLRETLYEKLPPGGRPLSYTEIMKLWTNAVMKKQHALYCMQEAQEECEDYASDIIAVVGQAEYNRFLDTLLNTLKQRSSCPSD